MQISKILFLFLSIPLHGQQLGFALEQINGQAILNEKLTGNGIKVGIIDGGFLGANENPSLIAMIEQGQVAGYRDYLNDSAAPYSGSKAFDDGHGTEVWELIGGLNPHKAIQYGLATGATYYLARTDHGGYERRSEEQNAIDAMEWMAAEGVRIINLSLGYNYGFDDKDENYTPRQIDGKSTILTQAIQRLSKTHDILFVVAAGNDGNNKWRIIDSPADARSALTVGATKFKAGDEMSFSSVGPSWLDYVKPEVSCYASGGTSFSTPIITGLAACLLEQDTTLTSQQLKELIIKSSNLPYPNNYLGYGIPNAELALKWLNEEQVNDRTIVIRTTRKRCRIEVENAKPYLSIYHKKNWDVLEKETFRPKTRKVRIKRSDNATSTTILWQAGAIEIFWK